MVAHRRRAQVAAELKAAIDFVRQADIDHGQLRQPGTKGIHGLAAVAVGADLVAYPGEGLAVVGADGGVVFDNGDSAGHGFCLGSREVSAL